MNIKKKLVATAVLAAAMALPTFASAQARGADTGFYVGGDVGQLDLDGADKDTGFRILGGYQINRNFSAELGYSMLYDKDDVDVSAWELVGVGKLPLNNNFSLIGKLGFAMWEVEAFGEKADGTDLTYAVGVQYDVSRNLGIRAQWQRYDVEGDADLLSVGLVYRF
jgi:OmpA-OmpF porin, OOP family